MSSTSFEGNQKEAGTPAGSLTGTGSEAPQDLPHNVISIGGEEKEDRQCTEIRPETGERCGAYKAHGTPYCWGHMRSHGLVPEGHIPPTHVGDTGGGLDSGDGESEDGSVVRAEGLKELRRLVRARSTPDAVRVSAAKALADWAQDQTVVERHPVYQQLASLTSEQRRVLISSLD